VLLSEEFYDGESEHFLTAQIQFDDRPEETSWILYDLTANEVRVFVDFDVYTREEYANRLLNLKVSIEGPDAGERRYAFTVYDRAENGLCCEHGEGSYRVFLGDPPADDNPDSALLGGAEFEFSESYYFTLFEGLEAMEEFAGVAATPSPASARPTGAPATPRPTRRPTRSPTTPRPTGRPTTTPPTARTAPPATPRPTQVWERMRPGEDAEAIGRLWTLRSNTAPGVFTDVGGDQGAFRMTKERPSAAAGGAAERWTAALACALVLALVH